MIQNREKNSTGSQPAPRTPVTLNVSYRRSYARSENGAIMGNISSTGAFLRHGDTSLTPGDKVTVLVSVSGRQREVPAMVIWSNSSGSGIRFAPQSFRDSQIVEDLVFFVESKRSGSKEILNQIFQKVS